jgi:site-specific DNA-methyltransferase (adenine-specific)
MKQKTVGTSRRTKLVASEPMTLHPISSLYPEMSRDEFAGLVRDIEDHGVIQPILTHENQIVDGRHRYRACEELEIECPAEEWDGVGSLIDLITSLNTHRRSLTKSQLAAIAYEAIPFYQVEAKRRQGARSDLQLLDKNTRKLTEADAGRARDMAGKAFNVSGSLVARTGALPRDVFQAVKRGELTTSQAQRQIRDRAQIERRASTSRLQQQLPDQDMRLFLGDFREQLKEIESGSVDLVLTDPPYPQEYRHLWGDLGVEAKRILKPGGFLVAFSGQNNFPETLGLLCESLDYFWLGAIKNRQAAAQRFETQVMNMFKPILIFNKPPRAKRSAWFRDLVEGSGEDKRYHQWGQDEQSAATILEAFSEPGDLVVDPFLGGGTNGAVCSVMKRRFVGCEIDEETFEIATKRIASVASAESE